MIGMMLLIFSGMVCGGVSVGAHHENKGDRGSAQVSRQERIDRFVGASKTASGRGHKLESAPSVGWGR